MWPAAFPNRLLHSPTPGERHRVERLLGSARVIIACGCLAAAWFGGVTPPLYARLVLVLLTLYAAESVTVAFAVRLPLQDWEELPLLLHSLDFVWGTALTLLTGGPASPFVVVFLFVLLSAAIRWGFRETALTAALAFALLIAEAHLLDGGAGPSFIAGVFDLDHLLTGGAYLAVAALVLGHFAEEAKLHRANAALLADLQRGMHAQSGFGAALRYVSGTVLNRIGAGRLVLVARESGSGRAIIWIAEEMSDAPQRTIVRVADRSTATLDHYLFSSSAEAWAFTRRGVHAAIDREGHALVKRSQDIPDVFWQRHPAAAAAAINIGFGGNWSGRAFLFRAEPFSEAELRFLHVIACEAVPALHTQYLLRRLQSRVAAAARRRLARELQNGIARSLSGLETQLAATRRDLASRDPVVDAQLQRLQRLVNAETRSLQGLMHQIRPFEAAPDQVLDAFQEMVQRFGRDTGIAARFWSDVHDVHLPPKTARELARALGEALTNVRNHASARQVDVRFTADDESWRMAIYNDGRPFGFLGRFSLQDLDTLRRGPKVMKERIRDMRGDLTIESSPSGVRLDIIVPRTRTQAAS